MGQARNICLVGHSGCGKTELVAALLKQAGVKEQISLDASQEEKDRGHTIDLGVSAYTRKDLTVTLLDAPGGDEFGEEMVKGVAVADLSLLVVAADSGVEVVTERAWELTGGANRPTVVLINQMGKENAKFDDVLASLRDHFDGKFIPLQLPIREGNEFTGVVDLIAEKATYFADRKKTEIPDHLVAAAQEARAALLEEVSTFDDELMMKFLEDQPISTAEASKALVGAVAGGELVPVLCVSASEGKGLEPLMDAFESLAATRGDPSAACRAVVFNLANDPYLGRLSYVRVLDGRLQEGKTLVLLEGGQKVEIRDLYTFEGTTQKRAPDAETGRIVAIGKAEELRLGATVATNDAAEPYEMPAFPRPIYAQAIEPKSQSDVEKMSEALREISTTKATIEVDRDPVTKEMLIHGMGDIHLSVFLERLKNRYNVSLETHRPSIPYKETIRKKAEAKYRHKKQTGGRGQFGEVELRVEPFRGEAGYQFLDEIKGAAIPGQYIPGVEKGVIEAMEEGNLAGFPVTHVSVAVFDGSFHPVDSSELAFKLAARHAFRDAFDKAQPVLLEPVMTVAVRVPEEFTGDIISDLNGRRGRILGMEPAGRTTTIRAEVPLSEMQSYALDLKSRTQGRATFQMEPGEYQPVPGNLQERIIAQAKQEEE